jgi:hypothetical protein
MRTRVLGRRFVSVTATADFLAPDVLDKCGRAVPAPSDFLHSTLVPLRAYFGDRREMAELPALLATVTVSGRSALKRRSPPALAPHHVDRVASVARYGVQLLQVVLA